MITIDQLNSLRKRVEDLRGYLAIDEKLIEIAEEEKRTQDPEFWTNSKEAELVMKRLRTLKSWTNGTKSLNPMVVLCIGTAAETSTVPIQKTKPVI